MFEKLLEKLIFQPVCACCGHSLGAMSDEEFLVLEENSFDNALCFDCDPESADTVPSLFWQWQEKDIFVLGLYEFVISGNNLCLVSRTHASASAPGLSSYTKLNKALNNQESLWAGVEIKDCPNCKGAGFWDNGFLARQCMMCDGVGVVECSVVLPAWVLGLGCENV